MPLLTQSIQMKRLILCALFLGAVGGLLSDLLLVFGWFFYPEGRNFFTNTVFFFADRLLFMTPICMTIGTAKRSSEQVRQGLLVGAISAIAASTITLFSIMRLRENSFFHPWFNHIFISTALLGVSAGVLFQLSENAKRWNYLLIGLFAGLLAGLSHYLTTFLITVIAIFLSKSSMDIAMLFEKFITPLIDGTAQSVLIWCCIALAERNTRGKSEVEAS